MANKVYYLDRDGATPQVVPANTDEKLKVFDTYEDIDTSELVDGEIVSTKEASADGSNIYDYINEMLTKENLLSDMEVIATGTYTMEYDGFIQAYQPYNTSGSGRNMLMKINGTQVLSNNFGGSGGAAFSSLVPVRKGDEVYLFKEGSGNAFHAWFYKQRYYGGRQ